MKKFMLVLLAVGLIALAIIPAACDKGTDPGAFSSYSLQGVTFSYPMEWIEQTAEMEQSMAEDDPNASAYIGVAAWGNTADSAIVLAMCMDMKKAGLPNNYTMTESDKESIAASMTGYMTTAMEKPTIVSQKQITVNGQWAWQMEFSGDIQGIDAKGYMLAVINDDTVFILLSAGQNSVWANLRAVYDTMKASIVM